MSGAQAVAHLLLPRGAGKELAWKQSSWISNGYLCGMPALQVALTCCPTAQGPMSKHTLCAAHESKEVRDRHQMNRKNKTQTHQCQAYGLPRAISTLPGHPGGMSMSVSVHPPLLEAQVPTLPIQGPGPKFPTLLASTPNLHIFPHSLAAPVGPQIPSPAWRLGA